MLQTLRSIKTLLPRTIAFQATALLVVGLAVTHFISNLFYTTDRESALLSAGGAHAVQWVATVGGLTDLITNDAWAKIVQRSQIDRRFVALAATPLVDGRFGDNWRKAALQKELARHVPKAELPAYRIAYMPGRQMGQTHPDLVAYFNAQGGAMPEGLIVVSLDLGRGTWLNMAAPVEMSSRLFALRMWLSMGVMLLAVVGLAAYLVRRMTAPLKHLSEAAEKLGTDVQAPAIAETGPLEVQRTARAFNTMQCRIRRFVEDRTQMLGAIAHDLGTPITRLRLRAEFVEDDELRQKMLLDLDDMQQMVASTLSFIREDTTAEPRAMVDIGSLLTRVCTDIEDTGAKVTLAALPRWVLAECRPVSLRRALGNLIGNAVKYGGEAQVSAKVRGRELLIVIEDKGAGIPADQHAYVFQPFTRLEGSRNSETGGTGLGLSVARTILRGHGGDITLGSGQAGGLRVEVRLPVMQGP